MPTRSDLQTYQSWPDVDWDPADKPVVIADGVPHALSTLTATIDCKAAHVVGVNEKSMTRLCEVIRTRSLHFYEMRVADIGPLAAFPEMEHLSIRWNTKVTDLSAVGDLTQLRTLVLEDVPKVDDLGPLSALKKLVGLDFSGGIWNKNRAQTLGPLAQLPELAELHLTNLAVVSDGLRPLAKCPKLRALTLSNQFATEDYAYLSTHLPNVECEMLAPYVRLPEPIGGKDIMVVGKRRPFLNSQDDVKKLARYVERFQALQAEFASAD